MVKVRYLNLFSSTISGVRLKKNGNGIHLFKKERGHPLGEPLLHLMAEIMIIYPRICDPVLG